LRKEMKRHWSLRSILVQSAIWFFLLNLVLALMLEVETNSIALGVTTFTFMVSMLAPFGIVLLTSGAIINEVKAGTAAWILSKPVSRPAFVISKLISIGVGFLVIVIILQGAIAFAQISMYQGTPLPVGNFIGALMFLTLNITFYFTLTIMLSTMFTKRVPVIGIPVALIIIQIFTLTLLGEVAAWLPYLFPGMLNEIAIALILDSAAPSQWLLSVFMTLALSSLFIYLAIWSFNRKEF
jgi:ABC-2 type transport system permease protein